MAETREQAEAQIETAAEQALKAWLSVALADVVGQTVNPAVVLQHAGEWVQHVHDSILPIVRDTWRARFEAITHRPPSRSLIGAYLDTAENRMVRVPDEVAARIQRIVARNIGTSIPDIAALIDGELDFSGTENWPNRATVIARTESAGAWNGAQVAAYRADRERLGVDLHKKWLATDDERTRETHNLLDGQTVPLDGPFTVGGFPMDYPGDPRGPAHEVINCVVGSTKVAWTGDDPYAATRRRFDGQFIKLRTIRGHDLTVTPNHPILTPTGYVPAGAISPGDHIMCADRPPPPQVDHGPPSIEQVMTATLQHGSPARVRGGTVDFHGDGSDSEIEIVGADGDLTFQTDTHLVRHPEQTVLVGGHLGEGALAGRGPSRGGGLLVTPRIGQRHLGTPTRLVGRLGQRPAFGRGHRLHSQPVSFRRRSNRQTHLRETPDYPASAESDFPRHLQDAVAGGMAPCQVVHVDRFTGSHDVYNLSTDTGWYSANGIAVHNCRCALRVGTEAELFEFALDRRERWLTAFNWVEDCGGLPSLIHRIARHVPGTESIKIATAVNAVKKTCATGDVNFPKIQQVNPGYRAEACAAAAEWEALKACARARD